MKLSVRFSNLGVLAIIGLAIAVLLATDIMMRPRLTVLAPVATEKVVTKEFCLTDDSGNIRARIAMNEYDSPCLQLFDNQGQTRAQLRLNQNGVPSLRLNDDLGRVRSVTGFDLNDMQPSVILFDENGRGRVVANAESPSINNKLCDDQDKTWQGNSSYSSSLSNRFISLRNIQNQNAQQALEQAQQALEREKQARAEAAAARDRAREAEKRSQ